MKGLLLVVSMFFSLVAQRPDEMHRSQNLDFPFYADEVLIASSTLESDSTKLVFNASGDPLFFSREVFTEACETGECYPIRITLFWDFAGSFLGFSVPDAYPLTKTGHNEFSESDYFQLFTLLNHPNSKISKYTKKELVKVNLKNQEPTDAVSGATIKVGNEKLVSGAAFTCLTLWDIVNRNTENLHPENFVGVVSNQSSQEVYDEKLSNLKKLSAGELALQLKQDQDNKQLRKFEVQMQLVNQLDECSVLHSLIINNYLNREKYLYPEVNEVLKKNTKIVDCFLKMTHSM
ncbi:hypothetical protein [uncultured Draconibacterium sp.]|uniref:hypothetical protein n=1 Tax=uncultured Draconibacterium sp. TaxID=1573823 RepID=UPI0029C94A70|nr:hypothetical protein [uncultured Draconibacterium sp.]